MKVKKTKITVTLRLTPEDALSVLSYCQSKGFINDKQYVDKTRVALKEILLP